MKINLINILFFLFLIITSILIIRTIWILSHTYTPDFSVYFQAAKNLLSSQSLYTGKQSFTSFSYPPATAVLFSPFIFLPYQIAQTVFLFISFASLIGISLLIPKIITKNYSFLASSLILAFSYLSFPTKFTLGMGQVNLVAYFFLLLSFYLQGFNPLRIKARAYRAQPLTKVGMGVCFAVACVLKPILGCMVLFWIFQKNWKVVGYAFCFGAVIFLISMFIDHHAIVDYVYYFQKVLPEVGKPVGREIYYNQGIMSFVFREISHMYWRLFISYLGIAVVFVVGIYTMWRNKNYLYQFSLLCTMVPLLDTLSWQHHFVFLIFPFAYAFLVAYERKKWILFGFLCSGYLLVSWNFAHPEMFGAFPQNFLLSNTFYGALLLFIFLLTNQVEKE